MWLFTELNSMTILYIIILLLVAIYIKYIIKLIKKIRFTINNNNIKKIKKMILKRLFVCLFLILLINILKSIGFFSFILNIFFIDEFLINESWKKIIEEYENHIFWTLTAILVLSIKLPLRGVIEAFYDNVIKNILLIIWNKNELINYKNKLMNDW